MSAETIYKQLRSYGLTAEGACGLMGNFQAESGCEAGRLQGDFGEGRTTSRAYVAAVTNGLISRQEFGGDQKGFGLAQWTYCNQAKTAGRKFDLYDFWKNSGQALDSEVMQVQFCVRELKQSFQSVWDVLTGSHDLYECARIVCVQFERPQVNNVDARYRFALDFFGRLAGGSEEPDPEPEPQPEPAEDGDFKIAAIQLIMQRDGYYFGPIDGVKNAEFRQALPVWAADVARC